MWHSSVARPYCFCRCCSDCCLSQWPRSGFVAVGHRPQPVSFALPFLSFSRHQSPCLWPHCVLSLASWPEPAMSLAGARHLYKAPARPVPSSVRKAAHSLFCLCRAVLWPHHSIAVRHYISLEPNTGRPDATAVRLFLCRCG